MQVLKLINSDKLRSINQFVLVQWHDFTLYYITMTDMEEQIEDTEQKKSGYAALREKHSQEMAALQAKLDEQIAGRAADKKAFFGDLMKGKGYE